MMSWKRRFSTGELREPAIKIRGFSKPISGVLPTGRSISGMGKKQKPWINRDKESRNLEHLRNFLHQEIKGEEMVNLALTGFTSNQNSRRNFKMNS
ncbi:hypothetical protein NPIL_149091 [Nephila pilipes]|uniref:Uncharacterized protein n=1 Tax=Nephila pilipes TaxID=299642 RepID=A0A8X6QLT8_NEPPI|nr:hypothetical protein NPIL_149091 [Nephila pilipes]